jgi:hypothetical protein
MGNLDAYDGGGAFNRTASLPPLDVTAGGVKTLTVTMSTKNAASSFAPISRRCG